MESRHDVTAGQELRAATETGQSPLVPATAETGERRTARRSSLVVAVSLVAAFAVVTLASL